MSMQTIPMYSYSRCITLLQIAALVVACSLSARADWSRFRGPNGSGVAADGKTIPSTWSATENLKWKVQLPGPGGSCPIVTGDKVLLTYWSGYGDNGEGSGEMANLELHLICLDRVTGTTLWDKSVKANLPELEYGGMLAQHGYASHTPVTDGKNVYAFFGKTGVHAFTLDGEPLWQANVGDGLDERKWGSSASPVLVGDVLVVTASPESKSVYGFDKNSGKQLWKYEQGNLANIWATPIASGGDVVLNAPERIVALDAKTGTERWSTTGLKADAISGSLFPGSNNFYAMGGRGSGSIALHPHGSEVHVQWNGRDGANILTPIQHDGHLYWISGDLAHCRNAETGEVVYSERLPEDPNPQSASEGGRDARFASMDYASPIAANGLLYHTRRKGEVLVVKLKPEFELVSRNRLGPDDSDFIATPAISDGQLFIRSMKTLYCVAE